MKTEIFKRYFEIEEVERSRNSRKVIATLSTEYPAMMGNGYREILEHTSGVIDMSRASIPVLDSHKHVTLPLGRVDDMRIVDRKLKGTLVFGSSQRASELWQNVQDGIARHLSISYIVQKKTRPDAEGTYRVTRWQPLECSIVSIPADPQALIGRAFKEVKNHKIEVKEGSVKEMRKYWESKNENANFRLFGEQLQAIASAGLASTGNIPEMWDHRLAAERAAQGLSEKTGGLGGFLEMQGVSEKLLFGQWSSPIIKKVLSIRVSDKYYGLKIPYAVSEDRTNGRHDGVRIY